MRFLDLAKVWRRAENVSISIVDDDYRETKCIFMRFGITCFLETTKYTWNFYNDKIIACDIDEHYNVCNKQELGYTGDYFSIDEIGEKVGIHNLSQYYVIAIRDYEVVLRKKKGNL